MGELTGVAGATLNGGMTYLFEINNAGGTPGAPCGQGWDLFTSGGEITLAADLSNRILLDVVSLSGTCPGEAAGFNAFSSYAWKFIEAGSEITFSESLDAYFAINTSGFLNLPGNPEQFTVARGDYSLVTSLVPGATNRGVYVVHFAAIPEPGTVVLAGIGLVGVGLAAARRRRRKARVTD